MSYSCKRLSIKIEAEEIIKEVRTLDQERLNEEVLHGFSNEIVKKYWTPRPFIKPHLDTKARTNQI